MSSSDGHESIRGSLGGLSDGFGASGVGEPVVGTRVRPEVRAAGERRTRRLPPYRVVLHNDDLNTFDHVARSLKKVFGYATEDCVRLTLEAHTRGRTGVWTGALEHAELKAEQLVACGPTPEMRWRGAAPLGVTIEPDGDRA